MRAIVLTGSLLVVALACLCACSRAREPQAGSQTHFLSDCAGSCPDPYSCVCGLCTLTCNASSQCGDTVDGAACLSGGFCSAAPRFCDLECRADGDCAALGKGFGCEQGRCRQRESGGSGGAGGAAAGSGSGGQSGSAGGGQSGSAGGGQSGRGGTGSTQSGAGGGSGQAGSVPPPSICALAFDVGPCDAAIPRWYFDTTAGECRQFSWGGCDGNDNNFETKAECESICGGGASSGGSCETSADCALTPVGCCAQCVPTRFDMEAVPRSELAATMKENCPGGPVACSPCPPTPYDPLRPVVRAACKSGQCTVVDLREEPESACSNDDDCKLADVGCCSSCGGDPSGWVSVSSGSEDPYRLVCDPIPPCAPCSDPAKPEPFCAADGHCSVRATESP